MPFPINNSRPAIPYHPAQILPNCNRYDALGNFPPTAQQLDGDFNRIIDLINGLAGAVNATAVGVFPGAANPLNANKIPTTDGRGNVSWISIASANVGENAISAAQIQNGAIAGAKIQAQAVGTAQLADGAATAAKIAPNAVDGTKILDHAVTAPKIMNNAVGGAKIMDAAVSQTKIADQAVTADKIQDGAVTGAKIMAQAVTADKIGPQAVGTAQLADGAATAAKISSSGAPGGDVLTANGAGSAFFMPLGGRILQIVSYEDSNFIRSEEDAEAKPTNLKSFKTAPFRVTIVPKKTNAKILIFYSINVGGGNNHYSGVTLCKNDLPFKAGKNDAPSAFYGTTHSAYNPKTVDSTGQYGCFNFSSLFVDKGVADIPIVYEVKKAHCYAGLNSGYSGGHSSVSVMHAIEVDV